MNTKDESDIFTVTCTAPVNIAVVKYWGKRDEDLILPTNSSLSVTLDQDQLCATTTIAASHSFRKDRFWLNGREESLDSPRVQNVLREIRRHALKRKRCEDGEDTSPLLQYHVHICSENNFPTAAGLASSAAGYACLVFALAKLFNVQGDISEIARQGSGSACRSIYGGFVEWCRGDCDDGTDSVAKQVFDESHWPDLHVLIVVVSGKKKHVGSTAGMQTSVKTSTLFKHRVTLMQDCMERMMTAIMQQDFQTFAELTMKESNQLHAICLDTYPPIHYMTDTSRDITHLVHAINNFYGENKVAYTFDAGPNACLYLLKEQVPMVMSLIKYFFPPAGNSNAFIQGITVENTEVLSNLKNAVPLEPQRGQVQYVIHTKVGPGPQVLKEESACLLNESGLPKKLMTGDIQS